MFMMICNLEVFIFLSKSSLNVKMTCGYKFYLHTIFTNLWTVKTSHNYVSIIKVILIVIKKNSYVQHKENISNGLIGNYWSKRDKILEFSY